MSCSSVLYGNFRLAWRTVVEYQDYARDQELWFDFRRATEYFICMLCILNATKRVGSVVKDALKVDYIRAHESAFSPYTGLVAFREGAEVDAKFQMEKAIENVNKTYTVSGVHTFFHGRDTHYISLAHFKPSVVTGTVGASSFEYSVRTCICGVL